MDVCLYVYMRTHVCAWASTLESEAYNGDGTGENGLDAATLLPSLASLVSAEVDWHNLSD